MNTIATPYGTIEIVGYTANEYRHAASMTDVSGPAPGYHERCGWCYLGAPHTADAHAATLGAR